MSQELLENLKEKVEVASRWKKGLGTWNSARVCEDARRRAEALLELNLAKGVRDTQEGFFQDISRRERAGKMWAWC